MLARVPRFPFLAVICSIANDLNSFLFIFAILFSNDKPEVGVHLCQINLLLGLVGHFDSNMFVLSYDCSVRIDRKEASVPSSDAYLVNIQFSF